MSDPSIEGGQRDPTPASYRLWPAEPRHLAEVRSTIRRWLDGIDLAGDTEDDLVLAVNEAASNVVDHAYRQKSASATLGLALWIEGETLCIEITDRGAWRPVPTLSNNRGRGLTMIYQLVDSVLIHNGTDGTRVLLRHPLPDAMKDRGLRSS